MASFWSFTKARKFVRKLELKTAAEWQTYCKSGEKPNGIPSNPNATYADQGWSGYADWLTDTRVLIKGKYRSYVKARAFVQLLGLKTVGEWRKYAASSEKPKDIPSCPYRVYADIGWTGYSDWLGVTVQGKRNYLPYDEAKQFVHKLGLKTKAEWLEYAKSKHRPPNIPMAPYNVYRYAGYESMRDWLGSQTRSSQNIKFRSFIKARAWVRKQKIRNSDDWKDFTKSDKMPLDIPVAPNQHYKSEWVSMPDWLGNDEVERPRIRTDRNQAITRDFKSARKFARSLGLKTKEEWESYVYSGDCPPDIPTCPNCYKQWINFADWLGNNDVKKSRRKK